MHASKTVAGLAVGQTVKYQCEFGYDLTTGDSVLTCALGPRWEGTMPSCKSRLEYLAKMILDAYPVTLIGRVSK